MAKKKDKSKTLNKIDIIVTIIYTLVFCYSVYVLFIMPETLDVGNFIILVVLVLPYLLRIFSKDSLPAIIALEILLTIIFGFFIVTWPTIKSSINYDCGWGEEQYEWQ